jgi:hypothetical protein
MVSGSWTGTNTTGQNPYQGQIGGMIINIQSIPAHALVISPPASTPQCGSNLTLTATVSGLGPFDYKWYDNHNSLIAGATNATLTLTNVRPSSVGAYTVIANNAYASVTNGATIDGVADSAPPIMALNGVDPVVIAVNNGPYLDAGATAFDLCAQGYVPVQTNSTVDVTTAGTYLVTYTATTAGGAPGVLTRTVNVVPVPNDTLKLDFAPSGGTIQPAPDGFAKVQNGAQLTVGNYSFPGVAGTSYTLSFTNIGSYNTGNAEEPLVTDGFYSAAANGPAGFTLSGLPMAMKVTLYATYAWDGAGKYANVFFGATGSAGIPAGTNNTQIVANGDPGLNPSLTNFTKIGAALVGPNCAVTGHWQGPGGPNSEGQVGAMVIFVGTNTPPAANNLAMSASAGQPAALQLIGGASAPMDPDGDPLTVTAVQSPTANRGTVTTDGINVTYTSAGGFSGTDSFTYTVGDGFGGFATATVTVAVTGSVNSNPVASNILMGALSGQPATLKIVGGKFAPTDPDNDPLTVTAVQSPTPNNGAVTMDGTNVAYLSAAGFAGTDTFTYTVSDGRGGSATATVTVDVITAGQGYNRVTAPALVSGHWQLGFQGTPHLNYAIDSASSLRPAAWTPVVTNQAGANGMVMFTITPAPGAAFYRTRCVP